MEALWKHSGIILGAIWKRAGSTLEALRKHSLEAFWKRAGSSLEALWKHTASTLEAFWKQSGGGDSGSTLEAHLCLCRTQIQAGKQARRQAGRQAGRPFPPGRPIRSSLEFPRAPSPPHPPARPSPRCAESKKCTYRYQTKPTQTKPNHTTPIQTNGKTDRQTDNAVLPSSRASLGRGKGAKMGRVKKTEVQHGCQIPPPPTPSPPAALVVMVAVGWWWRWRLRWWWWQLRRWWWCGSSIKVKSKHLKTTKMKVSHTTRGSTRGALCKNKPRYCQRAPVAAVAAQAALHKS